MTKKTACEPERSVIASGAKQPTLRASTALKGRCFFQGCNARTTSGGDPTRLDPNARAFLDALRSRKQPSPKAPGLVRMLAGMNVSPSAVDVGASAIATTGEAKDAEIVPMTPHVMVMPQPFAEKVAHAKAKYNVAHPLIYGSWRSESRMSA
ncbi:MAG TPA: hypothetical protein VMU18_12630 [Rhodoblastus sp.]|nr:hypothetical protein [Rhodoblastus sp.]